MGLMSGALCLLSGSTFKRKINKEEFEAKWKGQCKVYTKVDLLATNVWIFDRELFLIHSRTKIVWFLGRIVKVVFGPDEIRLILRVEGIILQKAFGGKSAKVG